MTFYLGIDFGTSGARAVVIDSKGAIQSETQSSFDDSSMPNLGGQKDADWGLVSSWQKVLFTILENIPLALRCQIGAIAIDGTSSTVLLCNANGIPTATPILYNDARGATVMDRVQAIAPPNHTVLSATSSLAKLWWWLVNEDCQQPLYFLHQADWLAFLLHGKLGISDYHNALKLGYDVANLSYPAWLTDAIARQTQGVMPQLPQVVAPGTPVGKVTPSIRDRFNFPPDCQVCAGTTDSIAAFLASGATSPGEAVTSLGSTLVIKLLSQTRVDEARYGIYSHRFGNLWLVGGASNTGGAVLRHFFTDAELATLSHQINPVIESPLDYYPLLKPGDRFPINDPNLPPRLEPRPLDPVAFLHGLLESMARIEAQGYQLLQQLGATSLTRVYTAGGGAKNLTWSQIRQRLLKVTVETSVHTAAAYGAAVLAMRGSGQQSVEIMPSS